MREIELYANVYLVKEQKSKGDKDTSYFLKLDLRVSSPSMNHPEELEPKIMISKEQYEEFEKEINSSDAKLPRLHIPHTSLEVTVSKDL